MSSTSSTKKAHHGPGSSHPDDPAMFRVGEALEDFIARCISQLHLSKTRDVSPRLGDFTRLDELQNQMKEVLNAETSHVRHEFYMHILPLACNVYRCVFVLRQFRCSLAKLTPDNYTGYVSEVKSTLDELLRASYNEEKRKMEVYFGLTEAVAELLIAEVSVFGLNPSIDLHSEALNIRKFIANLLTNLVYGNAHGKRLLCAYPAFLDHVRQLITDNTGLTTFYAALVRNLSWTTDPPNLTTIVPALANAAVAAHERKDSKCLLTTLSALWNLGSHSMDNKKAMSVAPHFLPLVLSLLNCEPANTVMVENASGILKYACGYVIRDSQLLHHLHGHKMIRQLVSLLNSGSFTIVANALSALSQLSEADEYTQSKLLRNGQAMTVLETLRESKREDIRGFVKQLLGNLHASRVFYAAATPKQMHGSTYYYPGASNTLMPLRHVMGGGFMGTPRQTQPQYDSLPRSMKVFDESAQALPTPTRHPPQAAPPVSCFLESVTMEAGLGIPESLLGTRSGSMQSLTNDMPTDTSWQSNVNTDASNSVQLSPLSESEIPDSPTEFAARQVRRHFGVDNFEHEDDGGDGDDDYYGVFGAHKACNSGEDALNRAIQLALPKSANATPRMVVGRPSPISAPNEGKLPVSPDCASDIDFDDSSVMDEAIAHPTTSQSSGGSSTTSSGGSKNATASTVTDPCHRPLSPVPAPSRTTTAHYHHPTMTMTMASTMTPHRHLMEASSLLQSPTTLEKVRDASRLCAVVASTANGTGGENDEGELSDDSYCCTSVDIVALEDLTAVPEDVSMELTAEKMVIDCSSLSFGSKNGHSASRLPKRPPGPRTSTPRSSLDGTEAQSIKIGLLSAATLKRLTKHPRPPSSASTTPRQGKSSSSSTPSKQQLLVTMV